QKASSGLASHLAPPPRGPTALLSHREERAPPISRGIFCIEPSPPTRLRIRPSVSADSTSARCWYRRDGAGSAQCLGARSPSTIATAALDQGTHASCRD